MRDNHGNETAGNPANTPSGHPGVPTIGGPDPATIEKINEHMLRGIEYRDQRQYDRAYAEFASSLDGLPVTNYTSLTVMKSYDYCLYERFLIDNICQMRCILSVFFEPGPEYDDDQNAESNLPEEAARYMAARANIPPGYLVTAESAVLASYPLTPEGRAAAIELADRLSHDGDERWKYFYQLKLDCIEFDTIVYEHETRPREIYRAV